MASPRSIHDGLVQRLSDVPDLLVRTATNYQDRSLVDLARPASVNPVTIVSRDLEYVDAVSDMQQTLLNIFAAYYLQAVSMLAVVDNVRVSKVLDKLQPDRHFNDLTFILESRPLGNLDATRNPMEYEFRLPDPTVRVRNGVTTIARESLKSKHVVPTKRKQLAVERVLDPDNINKIHVYEQGSPEDIEESKAHLENVGFGKDTTKALKEATNLGCGKVIEVTLDINENKITVPVSITLKSTFMSEDTLAGFLSHEKMDTSLLARWFKYTVDEITLADLVLCEDLVQERKKLLLNDTTGTIKEIMRRVNRNKQLGFVSNNPSLNTASNIIIMSRNVAVDVERRMGGKMDNPRIRDKIFDSTYAMLIAVMDTEREFATIYTRHIADANTVKFKDLKVSSGSAGPNISDIIKALSQGNAPVARF